MTDITAVGEILIDLTQNGVDGKGIPQFAANPGGAPANLAVAAARLGAKTAFIGKVGRDSFGDFLRSTLLENNVDVSGMVTDPVQHTTLAVVSLDSTGERHFSFYRDPSADVDLSAEEIDEERLKNTRILHFGSVSLTADPARAATLSAVDPGLYEAAKIDGASMFQRILHIDIPELVPQLIMSAGGIMSVGFEKVFLLQTQLNKATSDVIAVYVYQEGIENHEYSLSTAVGLFNTVINIILLIVVNKIAKKAADVSFV